MLDSKSNKRRKHTHIANNSHDDLTTTKSNIFSHMSVLYAQLLHSTLHTQNDHIRMYVRVLSGSQEQVYILIHLASYIHMYKKVIYQQINCMGVGTMGAGEAIPPPPPNMSYSSQCLPDHVLIKLLYCT